MKPVHYQNGVSTQAVGKPLYDLGMPDPTKYHTFFDDFDRYAAGDWTVTTTEAGTGSATEAITDGDGGQLLLTNAAGDNDLDFLQLTGETFKFESGKPLFFKARFKLGDVDASSAVMGLQITDTTPLDVTDGVFFIIDDTEGDGTVDLLVEKDGTATTAADIATLTDDTFVTLAFEYDGKSAVKYYVDDVHSGTLATTNLPDDEELTISFGVQNGAAAAKTMTVDYIFAAKER